MGLNRLDFLSNAPKNYIFRNTSNKTNFGGVLFLLYILIVFLITIYYLSYFFIIETYSIEYTYNEERYDDYNKRVNDTRYNPYFDILFSFYIVNDTGSYMELPYYIELINKTNNQSIPFYTNLRTKVSDIEIKIAMKYNDNVNDYYNDKEHFRINMHYNGFVLDHQNQSLPLYQTNNYSMKKSIDFTNGKHKIFILRFRAVKYKEDAGFLKLWNNLKNKKDEESQKIIGLKYNSEDNYFTDDFLPYEETNFTINGTKYKGLGDINTYLDYEHYEEYKRTKKIFWIQYQIYVL